MEAPWWCWLEGGNYRRGTVKFPLEMSLQEFAMPLNKKRIEIWNFVLPVDGVETRICNDIEELMNLLV